MEFNQRRDTDFSKKKLSLPSRMISDLKQKLITKIFFCISPMLLLRLLTHGNTLFELVYGGRVLKECVLWEI